MKTTTEKRRERAISIAVLAAAAFLGSAAMALVGNISSARAAGPKGTVAAYVWLGDATAVIPAAAGYSFNATGGANTVARKGTGLYEVKLQGVGTAGGHVQMDTYGANSNQCSPIRWNQSGADQIVKVNCFTHAGAPTDTQFSLMMFF
jgi:hypothetical protein